MANENTFFLLLTILILNVLKGYALNGIASVESNDSLNELEEMKAVPFDYYQLVLQWQPATCSNLTCLKPWSSRFSINGLWAGSYSGSIGRCNGSEFLQQNISSIRRELDEDWPSLVVIGSNPAVWGDEWDLHGTCLETPTFQISDYFRLALYLFWRSDVLQALEKYGMEPVDGRRYLAPDFESVLNVSFGKPALRCSRNVKYNLQYQLAEVALCFDKCLRHINCPSQYSAANGCPRNQFILWVKN
ncbi:ribonuclease DdI-like [Cucurbita pepo subsp. pepo]|uniref:ribonuclease DdI-like n=1 Tax=Cucurbita pepo subsp. pepo TaxID=3664 RepID=UPI000C9D37D7|nr:ribonuclease DdI-like [Cucurbita pepo subsp. pepo]